MTEACAPGFSAGHPEAPPAGGRHHARGHDHAHAPAAPPTHAAPTATAFHRRRLVLVLVLTLAVVAVQVVGALWSGSLALLADAAHMLTDAAGVGIALVASLIAALPATARRTFGYLRVEILAALVNGLILAVVSVVVLVEAIPASANRSTWSRASCSSRRSSAHLPTWYRCSCCARGSG